MKLLGNILYLEFDNLIEYGVPEVTIKMGIQRNKSGNSSWQHIPDPSDARRKLINYDTIPKGTIEKYGIPSREVLIDRYNKTSLTEAVKTNLSDLNWFLENHETHAHAHQYARKAAWFTWLAPQTVRKCREMGFKDLKDLYNLALELMKTEVKPTYNCNNWRVLSRDVKKFSPLTPEGGTADAKKARIKALESIINRHNCNRSNYKIKEEQQMLLIQIYSNGQSKPNFEQTWMAYTNKANEMIAAGRWDESCLITKKAIEHYLRKPEVQQLWYGSRHGYGEGRNLYDHINKRERASFANAKWVMDGTAWHRYYQVKGKAWARINVFVVIDEYSWCVIGFCASESENAEQVIRSLHQACYHAKATPYQLQYDNSSAIQAYRTQAAIESLVKYNTATEVGNARAKVVEPFFKQFNQAVLKFWSGYTGSPFMSKKLDGQGNREAIAHAVKGGELADENQAIEDLKEQFNLWNSLPFKQGENESRLERYQKSVKATQERQRAFTHMIEVDAFWEMPGSFENIKIPDHTKRAGFRTEKIFRPREYTYTNRGIQVTIEGTTHDFDIQNTEFWGKYIGDKFNIKYNPIEPDRIYLYKNGKPVADDEGNFLFLTEKQVLHSAMVDHTEGEMATIKEANELRKIHKKATINRFNSIIEETKKLDIYTPVIAENIYNKDTLNRAKALRWENEAQQKEWFVETQTTAGEQPKTKVIPSKWEVEESEEEETELVVINEPKRISRWE